MPWPTLPIVKKTAHGKNSASRYRMAFSLVSNNFNVNADYCSATAAGDQTKKDSRFPGCPPRPSRLESGGGTARPDLPSGQVPRIDFRYWEAAAAPRVAREVHPLRKPVLFLP